MKKLIVIALALNVVDATAHHHSRLHLSEHRGWPQYNMRQMPQIGGRITPSMRAEMTAAQAEMEEEALTQEILNQAAQLHQNAMHAGTPDTSAIQHLQQQLLLLPIDEQPISTTGAPQQERSLAHLISQTIPNAIFNLVPMISYENMSIIHPPKKRKKRRRHAHAQNIEQQRSSQQSKQHEEEN